MGKEGKWVLVVNFNPGAPNGGSARQYFIGDFNGTHFEADTDGDLIDFGKDFWR